MAYAARPTPTLVLPTPSRRAGGEWTWLAAALCTIGAYAVAVVQGGEVFLAAAVCAAFVTAFAVRPTVGIVVVLLLRPSLDLWTDRSLASFGGIDLNPASALAILLIAVGGAHVIERWGEARRAPAFLALLAFALVAAVSVPLAPSVGTAATEWLRFLSIVVTYALAYLFVRDGRSLRVLVTVLLLSAVVPIGVGIWQTAHGGSREIADFGRATGTFLHPNPFGIYLALVILLAVPILMSRLPRWSIPLLFAAPAAAVALVGSYTRTAWLAVFAGIVVAGFLRHRVLLVLAPAALVAVAVAVPSTAARFNDLDEGPTAYGEGNSLSTRFELWRETLPTAKRNPVTGQGLSGIQEEDQFNVHSDYVRTLVETGVFGFAAYLWILGATLAGCLASLRAVGARGDPFAAAVALGGVAAAVGFVLASFDSNLLTQVAVTGTAWALFACAHSVARVAPGPAAEPLFAPVWRPRSRGPRAVAPPAVQAD